MELKEKRLALVMMQSRLNGSRVAALAAARELDNPPTAEQLTNLTDALVMLTYDCDAMVGLAQAFMEDD